MVVLAFNGKRNIRISKELLIYFWEVIKVFYLIRYEISKKVCHCFYEKCGYEDCFSFV